MRPIRRLTLQINESTSLLVDRRVGFFKKNIGLTRATQRQHHSCYKRLAKVGYPMTKQPARFHFASAPDSWGVLDYPGPSWEQSYEKMLDEMVLAGYAGTELGPYGFFPTDPELLRRKLLERKLSLLGSFVPVTLSDPASTAEVVEQIRRAGGLPAALGAPYLVLADAQSEERDKFAGRIPADGSMSLDAGQWKQVA